MTLCCCLSPSRNRHSILRDIHFDLACRHRRNAARFCAACIGINAKRPGTRYVPGLAAGRV